MAGVLNVAYLLLLYMKLYQNLNYPKLGILQRIGYHFAMNIISKHMLKEQRLVEPNLEASDLVEDITEAQATIPELGKHKMFSKQYRDKVFYIWYNHGKSAATSLIKFIPKDLDDWKRLPSKKALDGWITDEFIPRAKELDDAVKNQLDALLIKEKVEMLKRHAELGVSMQNMAIGFLNENADTLSAPAAVRLLVEGIRIERESRGVPETLDKITRMTDDELMDQVKQLMTAGDVTLEEIDADS
jgi:hypothetical protein